MRDKDTKVPELAGVDPKQPFFMAVSIDNLDGSFTEPCGVEGCFPEVGPAIEHLKELIEEYNMTGFVFHCVPVRRVNRSKTRVTVLKPIKKT